MASDRSNLFGALLGLGAFGAFAAHDVVVKLLGQSLPTFQIVFFSVLFAFPLSTLMLLQDRTEAHLRPRHPGWLALRTGAVIITGPAAFYAFTTLPLAETYAILFASPLLITLLAIPILGEKVGIRRMAAVIVGLIGVLIVLRPAQSSLGAGHIAALVAAFGGALASVIVRKIGRDERTAVLLLYPLIANVFLMGALQPLVYVPMPLSALLGLAAMAVLAFSASLMLIAAYRAGEAAIIAPMQYSQMIWAVLYGALLFDETPDLVTLAGSAVIVASGLYIVLRESRARTSDNLPVLRTRSRPETGTVPRVGPLLPPETKPELPPRS